MRFGTESARAYECCWGHYHNCNRARIGMYCRALANAKVEEECRLKKIPDVKNPGDPPTNIDLSNQETAQALPKRLNHQFAAKKLITAPFRPDEVLDRIRKEVYKLRYEPGFTQEINRRQARPGIIPDDRKVIQTMAELIAFSQNANSRLVAEMINDGSLKRAFMGFNLNALESSTPQTVLAEHWDEIKVIRFRKKVSSCRRLL